MSERLQVTTYFLEMMAPPRREATPAPVGAAVERAAGLSASAYRELYLEVGSPWLWYERADLPDAELEALLREEGVAVYLLMYKGKCAGFSEFRESTTKSGAREVQILYFGLKNPFIGKGLGRYFLDWSVQQSFRLETQQETQRLWVHTCSLDHERALSTYEAAGFQEFRREYGFVRIPDEALERQSKSQLASSKTDNSPAELPPRSEGVARSARKMRG